jgi:hypothetical protein
MFMLALPDHISVVVNVEGQLGERGSVVVDTFVRTILMGHLEAPVPYEREQCVLSCHRISSPPMPAWAASCGVRMIP